MPDADHNEQSKYRSQSWMSSVALFCIVVELHVCVCVPSSALWLPNVVIYAFRNGVHPLMQQSHVINQLCRAHTHTIILRRKYYFQSVCGKLRFSLFVKTHLLPLCRPSIRLLHSISKTKFFRVFFCLFVSCCWSTTSNINLHMNQCGGCCHYRMVCLLVGAGHFAIRDTQTRRTRRDIINSV